ncbi:MAG: hypothetical protein PVSMB4_13750 [Ktedonobacterales bacterium]
MLCQLSSDDFARASPLFGSESLHLAVMSALAGESPAELYVDHPRDPHAGFLLLWNERMFLAGEPHDGSFASAVAGLLHDRYTPRAYDGASFNRFIVYDRPGWEAYLPALFADLESFRAEREYYHLLVTAPAVQSPLPPDFRVCQIDAALAADVSLGNHKLLLDETQSEAPSVAAFLEHRFGYCIQHGADVVAWCLSEYNHGHRCELGIETLPPYQRQGLAQAVARATIARAQRTGITEVGWDCWKRNLPSSALARRLGFELVAAYPVWYCRFGQPPAQG